MVPDGKGGERLIILPGEDKTDSTASGRPIGDEYWSVERKLEFMDIHGISSSIVSTANPWLDFLQGQQQVDAAIVLNNELSQMHLDSHGRLYGFCVL